MPTVEEKDHLIVQGPDQRTYAFPKGTSDTKLKKFFNIPTPFETAQDELRRSDIENALFTPLDPDRLIDRGLSALPDVIENPLRRGLGGITGPLGRASQGALEAAAGIAGGASEVTRIGLERTEKFLEPTAMFPFRAASAGARALAESSVAGLKFISEGLERHAQRFPQTPQFDQLTVVETAKEEGLARAVNVFLNKAPGMLGQQIPLLAPGIGAARVGSLVTSPIRRKLVQTAAAIGTISTTEGLLAVDEADKLGATDKQKTRILVKVMLSTAAINLANPLLSRFARLPLAAQNRFARIALGAGGEGITEGFEEVMQVSVLIGEGLVNADDVDKAETFVEAAIFGGMIGSIFSAGGASGSFTPDTNIELAIVDSGIDPITGQPLGDAIEVPGGGFVDKRGLRVDAEGKKLFDLPEASVDNLRRITQGDELQAQALKGIIENTVVSVSDSAGITPQEAFKKVEGDFFQLTTPNEITQIFEEGGALTQELLGPVGSPSFEAAFRGSKVVEEDLQPKRVFHFARSPEGQLFEGLTPFTHFGTSKAASDRAADINQVRRFNINIEVTRDRLAEMDVPPVEGDISTINNFNNIASSEQIVEKNRLVEKQLIEEAAIVRQRTIPAYLTLVNPISIPDVGLADASAYIGGIQTSLRNPQTSNIEQLGLSENQVGELDRRLEILRNTIAVASLDQTAAVDKTILEEDLPELLEEFHIDGLTYVNGSEDAGSTSYIALRGDQIILTGQPGQQVLFQAPKEEGDIKGFVSGIGADGAVMDISEAMKYIVRSTEAADFSTAVHELAHFVALTSGGQMKTDIEKEFQTSVQRKKKADPKRVEDWDKADHERFAQTFEAYWLTREAPTKEAEWIFNSAREALGRIYSSIKELIPFGRISAEKVVLFDQFFYGYGPAEVAIGTDALATDIHALLQTGKKKSRGKYYNNVNTKRFWPITSRYREGLDELGGIENVPAEERLRRAQEHIHAAGGAEEFMVLMRRQLSKGQLLDDAEVTAAIMVETEYKRMLRDILKHGDVKQQQEAFVFFRDNVARVLADAGNAAGRALSAFNQGFRQVDGIEALMQVNERISEAEVELYADIAALDLNDVTAAGALLERAKKRLEKNRSAKETAELVSLVDKLVQTVYFNAMLGNLGTLGVNFMSNALHYIYLIGNRAQVGMADAVWTGARRVMGDKTAARTIYASESLVMMRALWGAVPFIEKGGSNKVAAKRHRAIFLDALTGHLDQARAFGVTTKFEDEVGAYIAGGFTPQDAWTILRANKYGRAFLDESNPVKRFDEARAKRAAEKLAAQGASESDILGAVKGLTDGWNSAQVWSTLLMNGGTRLMIAFDMWAKSVVSHGELEAFLVRQEQFAVQGNKLEQLSLDNFIQLESGLHGNTFSEELATLTNKDGREFIDSQGNTVRRGPEPLTKETQLLAASTSFIKRMEERVTFTDMPISSVRFIAGVRATIPMGRLLIPFLRTPANLMLRGLDLTPGLGAFTSRSKKLSGKDPRNSLLETGLMQIHGVLFATMIWAMMNDGDEEERPRITGPVPANKGKKEAWQRLGIRPFSLRVENQYVSYRQFEPFGGTLGSITTALTRVEERVEAAEDIGEDFQAYEQMGVAIGNAIKAYADNSFMQGVLTATRSDTDMVKAATNIANNMVPYGSFFRQLQRAYEADQGELWLRERDTELYNKITGMPTLVQMFGVEPELNDETLQTAGADPRLNVFGEPISAANDILVGWLSPVAQFSPVKTSIVEPLDPVESLFVRANFYPSMPSKVVTIPGQGEQKLDDDIYRRYVIDSGKLAKRVLGTVARGSAASRPPEQLEKIIERVMSRTRRGPRGAAIAAQAKRLREANQR